MRVLLTGANGFIGSAVRAGLHAAGHEIVAATHSEAALPGVARIVALDLARAGAEDWLPHLAGVDAVVNTAGVLQDSPRDSTAGVHEKGADALFAACERAGIRRVIHFSAIGVDRATPTAFSRSKLAGDRALMARDLDWVILRPAVVVGRGAYGGSALFRGLASLPVLPVAPDTAPLQVVQREDVVRTVLFFLAPGAPARVALDLAGPEPLAMSEVVAAYRSWLGWPPARRWTVPGWLMKAMYRAGDLVALLGWRPPMRTTAMREIRRGAVGDPAPWIAATGIVPQSLPAALAAEPASVQERWFAQLYFAKPLVYGVLALFWIGTGIVSLGPGFEIGRAIMQAGGAGIFEIPGIVAGALADIAIGAAIAFRSTARLGLYGGIALSFAYMVIGTAMLPGLWIEPLGPMLKIFPIVALHLAALAIREDR
ncbi:SDR family oxidoreductase [Propylenella binzhouense]|uniref:SDR family oxidoreductase n=1 Tax=Propylenella binzhouense TaxID=2555902 RepID=A0A964T365_9HYPH|nr:SDR family oxidoreductase [Propylenella binzhouense]MYZ47618.1 SDR family oxidoreductase [Propylenella binzhouense]